MRVESLRKMPKPALQEIVDGIAKFLELKVETRFIKGDFIELTGKLKKEGIEKSFVLVFHTGATLSEEFLNAFKKVLKKENAEALVLTTGKVSGEVVDENLQIYSGKALEDFLESKGFVEISEKSAVPDFDQIGGKTITSDKQKVGSQSSLPSAGALEKYMKTGMKFFEMKEYEKALQWFDEALQLKPGYDRAISMKARTYMAMGKNEVALEIYKNALEMMPDKYELWYELGDLLHQLERYDEELECYTKILENNKKLDNVWNNMGVVYFIKEKYEDALFCFERANKLKPGTPNYLNNLATAQKKLGKHEEALSSYKKVLEIAPDYADVLLNIGLLYNEMEKYEEAYRSFRKYLLKEKNSAKGWHLAGIAAMNAGAYSQAIKCFEEALKIKPDLKEAKEGLKEAKRKFSQKGDKKKISEVEETRVIGGGVSTPDELQQEFGASEGKNSLEIEKLEVIEKREEKKEEKEEIKKFELVEMVEKEKEKDERNVEKPPEPIEEKRVVAVDNKEGGVKGLAALVSAIAKESAIPEEQIPKPQEEVGEVWSLVKEGEFERAAKMLEGKGMKNPAIALIAGYAHSGTGSFKLASEFFEIVLAQQKMHLPALFGKEFTAFVSGDYGASLSTLELLEKKFPRNPAIILKKCLVLYAKKQFDECEIELKKFAREMQHSELYWFIMGSVYQQKGHKENALKCFENALKIKPDFKAARKKIEEMEK
ncbi:MAG: tetratricopeptide repeat protein [Thermoplasmata archaeon]